MVNRFPANFLQAGQESSEPSKSTFLIASPCPRQDSTLARCWAWKRTIRIAVSLSNFDVPIKSAGSHFDALFVPHKYIIAPPTRKGFHSASARPVNIFGRLSKIVFRSWTSREVLGLVQSMPSPRGKTCFASNWATVRLAPRKSPRCSCSKLLATAASFSASRSATNCSAIVRASGEHSRISRRDL